MNKKRAEEYKENLKHIGDDAILGLEPVIKRSGENLLNFVKLVFDDVITGIFDKKRNKQNDKSKKS